MWPENSLKAGILLASVLIITVSLVALIRKERPEKPPGSHDVALLNEHAEDQPDDGFAPSKPEPTTQVLERQPAPRPHDPTPIRRPRPGLPKLKPRKPTVQPAG